MVKRLTRPVLLFAAVVSTTALSPRAWGLVGSFSRQQFFGSEQCRSFARRRNSDDDYDELDARIRQEDEWRRLAEEEGDAPPAAFRFPWDTGEPVPRNTERPQRKKKYSGGQELTGFWLWLRDLYDQVCSPDERRNDRVEISCWPPPTPAAICPPRRSFGTT